MVEVFTQLSGSGTLDLLGMTAEDLEQVGNDSALFATLRATHEVLMVLREEGVLGAFLMLPGREQSHFLRWIARTDSEEARTSRCSTFIEALKASPLAAD